MKKVTIKNHETKRTYKVLLKDDDTNVQNTIIELRKKYKYKVFYARELGGFVIGENKYRVSKKDE